MKKNFFYQINIQPSNKQDYFKSETYLSLKTNKWKKDGTGSIV